MKLVAAQVEAFLRDPGPCRAVLLFGDDAGMIRDRAEALIRSVAGSLDDPFLVMELTRDEIGRLTDEAASLPMTGGRRVVRVRETTDAAIVAVRALLKSNAPGLVVLEGAGLASRSRLRTELEAATDGAAIGCYPEEGRALEVTIRDTLKQAGVAVDPDALVWLAGHLGADRAATRAELEKLALYVRPGGRADLDAAMACAGDLSGLSLDDAVFAATVGDVATTDRALELAIAEGAAPVQVLRAGIFHLHRLQRARMLMDESGLSAADAAKTLRPPIFYRKAAAFNRALGLWSSAALSAAIHGFVEAERGCKRTGWPDQTLCRNALLVVARRAVATRMTRN
ncbi:MAG: DNA polymerase III subunit delta [Acetobacteraceae bacterium]|nr:DNA polymerase III subunit delta [Acetobacteraceae bacterium]